MLAFEGSAPVLGRTTDLSAQGVSVSVPHPVPAGATAQLRFDLLVDGAIVPVNTRAKASHCILSNGDFKVGFQFLNLDLGVMTALSRYLR